MRRRGDQAEIDSNSPLHRALNYKPNEYQTPGVLKEWISCTREIWGNAICYLQRDRLGRVESLHPLPPHLVTYEVDANSRPYYVLTDGVTGKIDVLEPSQVVHFRGLTNNGFWGYRLVEVAAAELGLGRQVIHHADAVFGNGAVPGGVLQHPGKLNQEAREQLRQAWESRHRGGDRAGRIAVLWEGMEFKPMAVTPVDAQLLETLADDPVRVGRLFQLAPHKLGDHRNSAVRANIEESNREFFAETLSRRVLHIKEELQVKCLSDTRQRFIKSDPSELLEGDDRTRMETAVMGVTGMLLTKNEARQRVGLNPVEGGRRV